MDSLKDFIVNFKYLMPALGKYKKAAQKSMLFTTIETILELIVPSIMAIIIDKAIAEKDLGLTVKLSLLMIFISLLCMYAGASATRLAATTSTGFGSNLRKISFNKIQEYGFRDLEYYGSPSLITRLTSDIQQIIFSVFMGTRFIIKTLVMAIVAVTLSVKISRNLSLIFLVLIPLLVLGIFALTTRAIPTFRQFRKEFDNLNQVVQENLANIRVVKAFVRNDYEIKKFDRQNQTMFKIIDKGAGFMSFITPISNLFMFLSIISIIYFGGKEIIGGLIGVGELMSFVTYAMMLLGAFIGISMVMMQMMMSSPGVVRVAEIIKHIPEMDESLAQEGQEVEDGSIDFDNVFFKYDKSGENFALSGVNLHIKSGETIGILGPTGSSKSTLVQLIPRLYDASSGRVKVGGRDVKTYSLEELRAKVNIVLQKNTLFSGTIAENLRWGNNEASDEEVIEAAKIAAADDFINQRDGGYNSVLGQGGVGVSGGQKQRLCIARSLLTKPKILILDNSTSAVDTKTEASITASLKKYHPDMTKIIISQRMSSFKDCDRIIVMDEGRIEGIGSHQELYATNEIYRKTYDIQEKGADE
ncbi:MAG: ABC transporter ATP-binding protein [Peptoniphilaceae bacterium]|nr:ABC transporter ATP-binding protein [Peptoniphilaceae bacterium]MDY6018697.1 ABC transporter ATP-binding protein [Anaerococcus sp.]